MVGEQLDQPLQEFSNGMLVQHLARYAPCGNDGFNFHMI